MNLKVDIDTAFNEGLKQGRKKALLYVMDLVGYIKDVEILKKHLTHLIQSETVRDEEKMLDLLKEANKYKG